MRKSFSKQLQFDCTEIENIQLNFNCRDEIIPILRALQEIYTQPKLRDQILELIAADVNTNSREDIGREGFTYWMILVLAAVKLGCNFDYDKLQDLAEQHRNLRQMMNIGDWDDKTSFHWRRIRDNIALITPATIEKISHLIVDHGHQIVPEAPHQVRADSFVIETDIHYPTESSLIADGLRKMIPTMKELALLCHLEGWRQANYLLSQIKMLNRKISRIATKKGRNYKNRIKSEYKKLLRIAKTVVERIDEQGIEIVKRFYIEEPPRLAYAEVLMFSRRTQQVMATAHRRVILGETVPNSDKVFSVFEPHTQLYRRGKAGEENQFGRLLLVYEDAVGFIVHHHLMDRDVQDQDVAVEQSRILQERLQGKMKSLSFDRGFHSPENQEELQEIVDHVCLPKPGKKQSAEQAKTEDEIFHASRQRHSGVESAVGALQKGNGLKRCRDRGEAGFERYVALGILGRNLHVLGKVLIAKEAALSEAAHSLRRPIAA